MLKSQTGFLLLCWVVVAVSTNDHLGHICSPATYASGSLSEKNLRTVLDALTSTVVPSGYADTTAGEDPSLVYGLAQCRGDIQGEECRNCISNSTSYIIYYCGLAEDAIIWYENCQLRYSKSIFFGILDVDHSTWRGENRTVSNMSLFNEKMRVLLNNLSWLATTNYSSLEFAMGEMEYADSNKVYGLVQCTRDTSIRDCKICLEKVLIEVTQWTDHWCVGKGACEMAKGSCRIRYDTELFYHSIRENNGKTDLTGRRVIIIVVSFATALLIIFCAGCASKFCCHRWNRTDPISQGEENYNSECFLLDMDSLRALDSDQELPEISLSTVQNATDNFSDENLLGKGGYGLVYKGKLLSGQEIAVKRLCGQSDHALTEYENEVKLVCKLQHKNLVKLLGCCTEQDERLLIYEYMPNRSLDSFLKDPNKRVLLDWGMRFKIMMGIARGILYLHQDSRLTVIHRDLKAGNILLDENMSPRISDFGMAKVSPENQVWTNASVVVGTYGYMSPEYAMGGLFSEKSDVYSFGVLLLEIIRGQLNSGYYLAQEPYGLIGHAWILWSEGKGPDLTDPTLGESASTHDIERCIHIALLCVQDEASKRPTMSSVIHMLESESLPVQMPQEPIISTRVTMTPSSKASTTYCINFSVNEFTCSAILPR